MKKPFVGIALASLISISAAFAAEDPMIQADGEAKLTFEDPSLARSKATDAAFVNAIQIVIGEYLQKAFITRNEKLLTALLERNPKQWVLDYRILSDDKPDVKASHVRISAAIDRKKLRSDLTRWGILFERSRRPSFAVAGAGDSANASWAQRVVAALNDLGYSAAYQSSMAIRGMTDLVVQVDEARDRSKAQVLLLKAQEVTSKVEMASVRYPLDAQLENSVNAGLAVTQLLIQALPLWLKQAGGGALFEISVGGLRTYASFQELKDIFNSGAGGFIAGREKMFAPGRVVFEVKFESDLQALVQKLNSLSLKAGHPKANVVGEEKINLDIR